MAWEFVWTVVRSVVLLSAGVISFTLLDIKLYIKKRRFGTCYYLACDSGTVFY